MQPTSIAAPGTPDFTTGPFTGRILMLGCGSVAQCSLPLLLRHIDMPADRITVMDFLDRRDRVVDALAKGVRYVQDRITQDNLSVKLAEHLGPGDLLIDLAWNIDCPRSCSGVMTTACST